MSSQNRLRPVREEKVEEKVEEKAEEKVEEKVEEKEKEIPHTDMPKLTIQIPEEPEVPVSNPEPPRRSNRRRRKN